VVGELQVQPAVLAQPVVGREARDAQPGDVDGDMGGCAASIQESRSAEAVVDCSSSRTSERRAGSIRSPLRLRTDVCPNPLRVLCTLPIARSAPDSMAEGGRRLQKE
jgi:hypothetical protein